MTDEKYKPPISDVPLPPQGERNEKLEELFFPVELREISWTMEKSDGYLSRYCSRKFFSLVRKGGNSDAFQVVTRDYRLFPYRDGYDLALDTFCEAFSQESTTVQPLRVLATQSLASCRIGIRARK